MHNALSIAMLGWKAQETTAQTLETYARARLYDNAEEFFIYFNQYSELDKAMADRFGVRSLGTSENLGIWGGMDAEAAHAKGDYILFLQDDHPVVVSPEETAHWIDASIDFLKADRADIVLLWHRFDRGDHSGFKSHFKYNFVHDLDPRAEGGVVARNFPPDWNRDTLMRKLRRTLRPGAWLRHSAGVPYVEREPEKVLPKHIRRDGEFLVIDSAVHPFSETPYLISKKFYNELSAWGKAHPSSRGILGLPVLEYTLNCRWWRQQHFRLAVCDTGVFSHRRVDDSWRRKHQAYNPEMVRLGRA